MQLSAVVLAAALLFQGGLVIKDTKKGTGPGAKNGDQITVSYVGKFQNGKVFDSTKQEGGQPLPLTLGAHSVIPGWEQGLLGMKVGGQRHLVIPPDLAYGPQGRPPVIPPNSTLVFDVTMVSINGKTAPPAPLHKATKKKMTKHAKSKRHAKSKTAKKAAHK